MPDALAEYLSDDASSYFTDQEWNETPAEREQRLKAKPVPVGVCPKCGRHIGRGIAFHVKACKG